MNEALRAADLLQYIYTKVRTTYYVVINNAKPVLGGPWARSLLCQTTRGARSDVIPACANHENIEISYDGHAQEISELVRYGLTVVSGVW